VGTGVQCTSLPCSLINCPSQISNGSIVSLPLGLCLVGCWLWASGSLHWWPSAGEETNSGAGNLYETIAGMHYIGMAAIQVEAGLSIA